VSAHTPATGPRAPRAADGGGRVPSPGASRCSGGGGDNEGHSRRKVAKRVTLNS